MSKKFFLKEESQKANPKKKALDNLHFSPSMQHYTTNKLQNTSREREQNDRTKTAKYIEMYKQTQNLGCK